MEGPRHAPGPRGVGRGGDGRARARSQGHRDDRGAGTPPAEDSRRRREGLGLMPGFSVSRESEPAYAGAGATFSKLPLALDPKDLAGADVAIVGAPIDETVTYRPGARFGPRAIRLADVGGGTQRPNMDLGVNAFEVLTVVDYGDAEVVPADQTRSHQAIRRGGRPER